MVKIRRITHDDPLHQQARHLRQEVLFGPLGLTLAYFDEHSPGLESRAEHYVCVFDHPLGPRVIGCAMLLPGEPDPSTATIAQVGVDRQRQGEGIGRRLLTTLESRAFGELGMKSLTCMAHQAAVGFYVNLGWTAVGDPVIEAGIPHQRLVLSPDEAGIGAAS